MPTEEISYCPMLDLPASQAWAERVLSAQPHWTRRHPSVPFFTLGMAAYLDAMHSSAGSASPYSQRFLRDASNRLLLTEFDPIYQQLCSTLGQHFGVEAHLIPEQAAVPGFHIHLPHPVFANEVASIHRDLQFQQVFPNESLAPHEVFTFTLPLSLPPGSGLNLWLAGEKHVYPYRTGELVIHSGLQTHQAVLCCAGDVPPRIALQGHGVMRKSSLALYW